jgi:hypothetical protein
MFQSIDSLGVSCYSAPVLVILLLVLGTGAASGTADHGTSFDRLPFNPIYKLNYKDCCGVSKEGVGTIVVAEVKTGGVWVHDILPGR